MIRGGDPLHKWQGRDQLHKKNRGDPRSKKYYKYYEPRYYKSL